VVQSTRAVSITVTISNTGRYVASVIIKVICQSPAQYFHFPTAFSVLFSVLKPVNSVG